ncbi:SAM-dependent methyltransferase [Amycolatopsis keratiniphila]|uniref:Cyclopropane-fatty-acyl-phospholipid synthase n=1 Tax=Amycolatopsis keratiniphila subsp. keratiniphila TaxID=227715 RepID=A0A1W2LLR8_9PSEU|nr:cyclopropane-fatty-acyl-phospholipid synthase family protein [Amycolatopsis keratiniphila]OLZ46281.1 cyclopropane-fatty-acyl-phospholipid synthase [Amycolatopsis keratiniphila subsp. nogabecina]ONF63966.1 cyclopropane-fatty-acyl-phospholipid synthase [Amycolatopsis keratiniphila subsp. keratiniphila]SDU30833.1 cyclopropane-fatty-acyl-phospholipid synthase [Amycolatopsis keratiniphila]
MSTSSVDRTAGPSGLPGPGETRWPGLATPPHSPFRARIAEQLFRHAVRPLNVRVRMPDGSHLGAGGPDAPEMRLNRPAAFFHRLGVDAKIGFGEAYMVGDWTSDALAEVLTPFAERMATLIPPLLQRFRRFVDRGHPDGEENSVEGARSNIHRHYDLSNDLFGAFLDPSMMYSSALFGPDDDLTAAQHRKIDSVLDYAGVREGSTVLEIGTGWGELSIRAAARGAQVTSLTISEEQAKLATERIAAAGFADRVDVRLCDYRDSSGEYDAVVSVEMIEAVGEAYWPTFFETIGKRLKPGGRLGLQAITMDHERMLAAARSYTWMHKYIFPGGLIPSTTSVEQGLLEHARLRLEGVREFGQDYARTLRLWRERFTQRWGEITELGFDDVFKRMWEFYLAYSEAGFRSGYLKVHQFGFAENGR